MTRTEAGMTTEPTRTADRAERKRRDEARVRTQRLALVVVVAVIAVAGVAFALKPAAVPGATTAASSETVALAATASPGPAVEQTSSADTTSPVESTATVPATPTAPVHARLKPAPGVNTIVVDKSEQRVTLYKADGTWVDSFLCASGKLYPRIGKYKVYGHRKQSFSLYDDTTFFYFTMFVKSDKGNNIGFHSIPQHPNGKLVGGLGKPVSHGCVRLAKAKAKFVYSWAKNGTRVIVKK